LESKFSLPNDEKIQTDLIGEWSGQENGNELLIIEKNTDQTYKLIIVEEEKKEELIAFSKSINGFNIMNVITENDDKVTNVFYGFSIEGNTLTFSVVNEKLREGEFNSETELFNFFQENVSKKEFFINPIKLKRI
jgi:Holliday junction resolvase